MPASSDCHFQPKNDATRTTFPRRSLAFVLHLFAMQPCIRYAPRAAVEIIMLEAVQALQSSIEIVGRLRSLSKKIEDAEFKMLLADLSSGLGDAKLEVANLKVELAS